LWGSLGEKKGIMTLKYVEYFKGDSEVKSGAAQRGKDGGGKSNG